MRSRRARTFDSPTPRVSLRSNPGALIDHLELERGTRAARDDRQLAATGARPQPVAERVLDQRLQDQRRHQRAQRRLVDAPPHAQAVAEPDLLDLDVAPQEIELGSQRRLELGGAAQQRAQDVPEQRDHLDRARVIGAADQHRDAVERVEQEVRLQLQAERAELRLDELRRERRLLALLAPHLLGVRERVADPCDARVRHQHERRPAQDAVPDRLEPRLCLGLRGKHAARDGEDRRERDRGGGAGRGVHGERASARRPGEWEAPAERQDRSRRERPQRPGWHLRREQPRERQRLAGPQRVEVGLERRDEHDRAPCDDRDHDAGTAVHVSQV